MKGFYRYVYKDRDRHGNVRHYFQRSKGGRKHRLRGKPGDADFHHCYNELLQESPASAPVNSAPAVGKFRWLAAEYFKSAPFKRLDKGTQAVRRRLLEHMLQEPIKPGSLVLYGDVKVSALSPKALEVLRDRKADLPEAANARVKALRMLFKWGKKVHPDHIRSNPARDLERVEHSSQGHHTWTVEEVARYEERHSVGTKARLALCLLMWTGVRRSDLVLLGRQHQYWQIDPVTKERKRWLKFTAHKNRNRNPVVIDIPLLPELQEVIAASSTGDLTFLVTECGQRFSAPGFGNKFREWCNQAGLPHCSAHGLRKAGATSAAENGASTHELMSIFGWLTMQEAERYTRAARRKKMAGNAMGLLVRKD